VLGSEFRTGIRFGVRGSDLDDVDGPLDTGGAGRCWRGGTRGALPSMKPRCGLRQVGDGREWYGWMLTVRFGLNGNVAWRRIGIPASRVPGFLQRRK
jgi:hypothetical protein